MLEKLPDDELASKHGWKLEAWAVMANHYHLVAHSPSAVHDGASLRKFLSHLHTRSATCINKLDGTPGRRVWYNFRETHLTYQTPYLARLNYTASKCRASPACAGGQPVPLVFGGVF